MEDDRVSDTAIVSSIFSVVLIAVLIWLTVTIRQEEQAWKAKLAAERASKPQKHGTDRVTLGSDGVEMYRICFCGIDFPNHNEMRQHQIEQAELAALGGKSNG